MEVKCATKSSQFPLEGLLRMFTHKGESPQQTGVSRRKMRALLSPLRDNLSCVVGMPICEERLVSVQRHTPEVQQQNKRFLSSVQNAAAEA